MEPDQILKDQLEARISKTPDSFEVIRSQQSTFQAEILAELRQLCLGPKNPVTEANSNLLKFGSLPPTMVATSLTASGKTSSSATATTGGRSIRISEPNFNLSPHEAILDLNNDISVVVVSGSSSEDNIAVGVTEKLNIVSNSMDASTGNRESEIQSTEGLNSVVWKNKAQSHYFFHISFDNGLSVGNTLLGSEAHTSMDVGNRLLNDNFGEENVYADDSYEKMQVNSERVMELILEKWKSRVTAKTQSQAKLVQWFIHCLQLCHCMMKDIILFCKEAFDEIGEMTQTSLSQVSTTLNINFQDVRRAFEIFLSNVIKLYNHSSLNCKVGAEIWPPDDGEWLDLDGETCCRVVIEFLDNKIVKELATLILKAQKLESSTIVVDRSGCCGIVNACVGIELSDKEHNILDEMNALGGILGLDVHVAILNALCKEHKTAEATQLVMDISNSELKLDMETYYTLIEASMSSQDFQSAFDGVLCDLIKLYVMIYSALNDNARNLLHDDTFGVMGSVASSLVDMYAHCGTLKNAYNIYNCVRSKSLIFWTTMINAYGMHGHGKEAIYLFETMHDQKIVSDHITFLVQVFDIKGQMETDDGLANNLEKICLLIAIAIIQLHLNEATALYKGMNTSAIIQLHSLLNWLVQPEHEHRKWSAAIFFALISSCLHVNDHKQKFGNIARLVKVMCSSKSTLVKVTCGVILRFSCHDLLSRADAADNSSTETDSEKDVKKELAW